MENTPDVSFEEYQKLYNNYADHDKKLNELLEENERLKRLMIETLTEPQFNRIDKQAETIEYLASRVKELETVLHKVLKESVGGNLPFSYETYNEIKAALNL